MVVGRSLIRLRLRHLRLLVIGYELDRMLGLSVVRLLRLLLLSCILPVFLKPLLRLGDVLLTLRLHPGLLTLTVLVPFPFTLAFATSILLFPALAIAALRRIVCTICISRLLLLGWLAFALLIGFL